MQYHTEKKSKGKWLRVMSDATLFEAQNGAWEYEGDLLERGDNSEVRIIDDDGVVHDI